MKQVFFDIVKEIYKPHSVSEELDSSIGSAKEFNAKLKPFLEKIYVINRDLLKKKGSKKNDKNSDELNYPVQLDISILRDNTYFYFKNELKKLFKVYGFDRLNKWIPSPKTSVDSKKLFSFTEKNEVEKILHLQFVMNVRILLFKIIGMDNPNVKDRNYYDTLWDMILEYESRYKKILPKIRKSPLKLGLGYDLSKDFFFHEYISRSLIVGESIFPKDKFTNCSIIEYDTVKTEIYYACDKAYRKNPNQDIDELIQKVETEKKEYFNKWYQEECDV